MERKALDVGAELAAAELATAVERAAAEAGDVRAGVRPERDAALDGGGAEDLEYGRLERRRVVGRSVVLGELRPATLLRRALAHVNVNGGYRGFSNTDIDKVDKQLVYGVDGAVYVGDGGFAVEGGWLHSDDDDTDTTGLTPIGLEVDEYFGGLRYTLLKDELIEPYIAAGATWLDVTAEGGGASADSDGFAAYARVGAAVNLGALRLGLDGRGVFFSDIDFPAGENQDVDYLQIMAFAGVRF